MLVPMNNLVKAAQSGGYAVPGFNYYNQATAEGIVEEAEAKSSPVVLMIATVYLEFFGISVAAALGRRVAERVKTPVALHLDHGSSYELAEACVNAGFTSVMIDGSRLPYEENVALTARVVKMAHAKGVTVEAELGAVGGIEDAEHGNGHEVMLIDPEQAGDFTSRTGIDCLAPAIGTVHGITRAEPRLDLPLLEAVRKRVDVPLVLHGGSGLGDDTVRKLIRLGINKANIGSELKIAWRDGLSAFFAQGKYEPRLATLAAKEYVRKTVSKKIDLFGSAGKA